MRARVQRRRTRQTQDPRREDPTSLLPIDPRDPDVVRVKAAQRRRA